MTKSKRHMLHIPVWFHSTEAVSINKVRYGPSTEIAAFFNGHLRETLVDERLSEELSLTEKINKLNDLCEGTLCITHYLQWNVQSYGKNTILSCELTVGGANALSFEECIDKAFKIVKEAKR